MTKLLQYVMIPLFCFLGWDQPQPKARPQQAEGAYCEALHKIIEASRTDFKPIKGHVVHNNNGFWRNVYWVSKITLPGATDCRIKEDLETSFECIFGTYDAYSPTLLNEYKRISKNLRQCIPANWVVKEENNSSSSLKIMECSEKEGKPSGTRMQLRLLKISENTYQIDFRTFAAFDN